MSEKDRGRTWVNAAGGIVLGLAFLAADSGTVIPAANLRNIFDTKPSPSVIVDYLRTSGPSPIGTVEPLPTKVPEATSSSLPTQEVIFTGKTYKFWMPGIPKLDKPIKINNLGCDEGIIPDKSMEVWSSGCAGPNNLFLMGHADGIFEPLRAAYKAKQLKIGEVAYYTNGIGQLFAYKIISVDNPTVTQWGKGSSWAETTTPVMTLDTCDDGKVKGDSTYRIIVRLIPTEIPTNYSPV